MPNNFNLVSEYQPSGHQPRAIEALTKGVKQQNKDQVLLGVTGSGKTFTMANVIQETQKPALILAHNKTLAAQLYGEMKAFFPNNAVEYFVSYYDYYQPEAYVPRTDTYIEKDSAINEQIDLLRHSATRALLERRDVVVVASVSCIYGLGSPELYLQMTIKIQSNSLIKQDNLIKQLIELQYQRNDIDFQRGTFRKRGDSLDIFPSHYEDRAWRITSFGDEVEKITEFDPLTGEKVQELDEITIFANSHYVTPRPTLTQAVKLIKSELKERIAWYEKNNQLLEAQRIEQRTMFDMEMIQEAGSCKGIENYSRYLSGRKKGEPPPTLFEYLPKDALLFVDESHVTVPQIGGMYKGDRARKQTLCEYGFRLPSALDNRPLKFEEWDSMRPQTIYVSATPGELELQRTNNEYVEQIVRPTGIVDPVCIIKPATNQIDDLIEECKQTTKNNFRVLVTTLTKKMAENLTEYLDELNIKVKYLHSDVKTIERYEIIQDLRKGMFDILVGVNLLREGLDIPECGLVAILDADKEGFLRSETSLIQTIGRAARNIDGRVILYADKETGSIKRAISETDRRRKIQLEYNKKHGITATNIKKSIHNVIEQTDDKQEHVIESGKRSHNEIVKDIEKLRKEMLKAAAELEFEKAAKLRDAIAKIEMQELGL